MSTLIVEVCNIDSIDKHEGADRLEILTIKGWKTIARKGEFKPNQKVVYFPPDCVLLPALANSPYLACKNKDCSEYNKEVPHPEIPIGYTCNPEYLKMDRRELDAKMEQFRDKSVKIEIHFPSCAKCQSELKYKDGTPGRLGVKAYCASMGANAETCRVKAARLRGVQSFGFVMAIDLAKGDLDWPIGTDVKEHFGVTKWEPPEVSMEGDSERPSALFHTYTDIENYGNFPDVIHEGEQVVITEKCHGSNVRVGLVKEQNENGEMNWVFAAGSHGVRRREFNLQSVRSRYWEPMTDNVKALLSYIQDKTPDAVSIIVFGELYGKGIQDLSYGQTGHAFCAFDIAVNRNYLSFDDKMELFNKFNIPHVPILYRGPFSKAIMEQCVSGPTTICKPEEAGKFKGREGIVVVLANEKINDRMMRTSTNGRVILKYISADFLDRKGATDSH